MLEQMRIKDIYSLFKECTGVTIDSRKVEKDNIFFAIKGDRFDGNIYAEKAINNGAKYAIIDNPDFIKGNNYILVDNVLEKLQELARYHVRELKPKLKVVALTGSNGKTTTKELIAKVLSSRYRVQFTEGNLNNHIGVPLTVLKLSEATEIAVIEMGANHHKEIELLASIGQPDVGLITNIGEAHIEGFGSIEGVLKAKSELFDYLENEGETLCVNLNDEYLAEKYKQGSYSKKVFYGGKNKLGITGEILNSGLDEQVIAINFEQKSYSFKTKLIGQYNLDNFLAAFTIGKIFNISEEKIVESLSSYRPNLNRSQFIETKRNRLIVDTYNANPTSMQAALTNLINIEAKNKVAIIGGMKELGENSRLYHRQVADILSLSEFFKVFLIGDEFNEVKQHFTRFGNVEELIENLKKENLKDCTILIKGSRANQLEKVVDFL